MSEARAQSTQLERLCRNILRESYGSIVERVGHLLLTRGRLSMHQLKRLSGQAASTGVSVPASNLLSTQQIARSLFILMNHNIVLQAESEEGHTYYSVSTEEILKRSKMPIFVQTARAVAGEAAAQIIRMMGVHGKLSFPKLLQEIQLESVSDDVAPEEIEQAFLNLKREGFLVLIRPSDTVNILDKRLAYLKSQVESSNGMTLQQRKKVLLEVNAMSEFEEQFQSGRKRKAEEIEYRFTEKRGRIDDMQDENSLYRIHYPRFFIHLRNEIFVSAARSKFGDFAGAIVDTALRLGYKHLRDMGSEISIQTLPSVVTAEDITHSLQRSSVSFPQDISRRTSPQDMVRIYLDTMSTSFFNDDKESPLAHDSTLNFFPIRENKTFSMLPLFSQDANNPSNYFINVFKSIAYVKQRILESRIKSRYGVSGLSLWRCLLINGKQSEQSICSKTMLDSGQVRNKCFEMVKDGVVQLQDIPRTRDYTKNFHLFYLDTRVNLNAMLTNCYQVLNNLYERLEKETTDRALLLEKIERDDIQGDLEKLPEAEQHAVMKFNKVRNVLMTEIIRLERECMVLTDL